MLAEALASVRGQSDPGWLAVVAEDGDGPPARDALPAALLADPRVAFERTRARSPGGARNAAIRRGAAILGREPALVAFLDDDDLWLPTHLALARAAILLAPASAFAHGAAVTRAERAESPYHEREEGPLSGDVFRALLRRDFVATSSVLARGDALLSEGLFREDLRHGEDWDLWLKLARRGPVAFVAEPAVVYRSHEGSLSREMTEKASDQAQVLSHWWRRRHLLAPRERRLLRRELARRLRRHARRLRREGSSA